MYVNLIVVTHSWTLPSLSREGLIFCWQVEGKQVCNIPPLSLQTLLSELMITLEAPLPSHLPCMEACRPTTNHMDFPQGKVLPHLLWKMMKSHTFVWAQINWSNSILPPTVAKESSHSCHFPSLRCSQRLLLLDYLKSHRSLNMLMHWQLHSKTLDWVCTMFIS